MTDWSGDGKHHKLPDTARLMKVTPRTHTFGIALYSLPFLAIIGMSLLFVSAGNAEIIVAGVALVPALLHFFGLR
jgi:hypothetical protein